MKQGLMKKKDAEEAGEIDLTPMLDVVFILLIFFIVTSVFVTEAGIEVTRPEASTAEATSGDLILQWVFLHAWMARGPTHARHCHGWVRCHRFLYCLLL